MCASTSLTSGSSVSPLHVSSTQGILHGRPSDGLGFTQIAVNRGPANAQVRGDVLAAVPLGLHPLGGVVMWSGLTFPIAFNSNPNKIRGAGFPISDQGALWGS